MEEFSALAARVAASVGELRGCLILSRDGLVLGAFPEGDEGLVKPAWLRFATLGEPDKGFVEFGDEVWGYVRRGPYAAFAVTGTKTRPGLLIDQLEQVLLTAEESRSRREALRIPEVPPAPSGKPRTSLHPEPRHLAPAPAPAPAAREPRVVEPPVSLAPAAATAPSPAAKPPAPVAGPSGEPSSQPPAGAPAPGPEAAPTPHAGEEDGTEIDRVLLAQEFSRLLQETRNGDED